MKRFLTFLKITTIGGIAVILAHDPNELEERHPENFDLCAHLTPALEFPRCRKGSVRQSSTETSKTAPIHETRYSQH